ncbi:hypothetical protein ACFP56_10365 [Paenibacillus septentrionalis]|uniref:DUF3888 domain-containing protein n=1 Tax=Paenibacillus septentrionalis TaxID=429342 RepID=A0ABW1V2K2_9BACL
MKKKLFMLLFLCFALLSCLVPSSSAKTELKCELLEQALLQQLHPIIYKTLQSLYNEAYPQFEEVRIIQIDSYVTGNTTETNSNREASASGGAKVFHIVVQARAVHHQQLIQLYMDNEQHGSNYIVSKIKQIKIN